MLSNSPTFLRFWHSEPCRNVFLSHLDSKTLLDFRLVCHDFATKSTSHLFKEITVTFKSSSFTKLGRMAALEHIGHHVKTLTFRMPHTEETFLPPLLDPYTGEQRSFVYTPEVNARPKTPDRNATPPKYGSWEVTELLIQQYPPIFHAATNVNSFLRALSALPYLSHVRIECPGQELAHRCRRSAVDYALISLRMAIERAPLFALDSLTLASVHPTAFHYLQPALGPGSNPKSIRRWAQIKNLSIEMSAVPFTVASRSEHLRMLSCYLRFFSPTISQLNFRWLGSTQGPSPLTLSDSPCDPGGSPPPSPTTHPQPPHSPSTAKPPRPLTFPKLRYLVLENAVAESDALRAFIARHRRHLREFVFEDTALRGGDWADTLASLSGDDDDGAAAAPRRSLDLELSMDVPCMLSPVEGPPLATPRPHQQPRRRRGPPRAAPDPDPDLAELRVMETLEPQAEFQSTPVSRGFARWLERRRERRRDNRKEWVSGPLPPGGEHHFRRMLKGSVFGWR